MAEIDWKAKAAAHAEGPAEIFRGAPFRGQIEDIAEDAYLAGVRAGLEAAATCAARDTFYVADEIRALIPE